MEELGIVCWNLHREEVLTGMTVLDPIEVAWVSGHRRGDQALFF